MNDDNKENWWLSTLETHFLRWPSLECGSPWTNLSRCHGLFLNSSSWEATNGCPVPVTGLRPGVWPSSCTTPFSPALPDLQGQQDHVCKAPLSLWMPLCNFRCGLGDFLQIPFPVSGWLKGNNWVFLFQLQHSARNMTIKLLETEQLKTTPSKWTLMSQKPLKAVIRGQWYIEFCGWASRSHLQERITIIPISTNVFSLPPPPTLPTQHLASH